MSRALKKLGERLREARAAAGISQAELGSPYFTRAHVSAIELGKIRPAMPALEHMARKLGKPASYFLDDADAERARRERELEMSAIGGLLTLTGAAEALRRTERLLDTDGLAVRETARLRLAAGTALNLLHRGPDATRALTVAQRLAMELRDDPLGRAAEYQLAVATRISGNPRGARELLETLLRRLEGAKPPDRLLTLRILITLGGCAQDLGEPAAATTYYQRALEWSNEIGDLGRITFIHQGLGNVYRSLGDQDAAAGHYQKALAAAELAKDLVGVLIMHNALAVLSADAGRIESAYGHVARAIEIARVSGPAAYLAHGLEQPRRPGRAGRLTGGHADPEPYRIRRRHRRDRPFVDPGRARVGQPADADQLVDGGLNGLAIDLQLVCFQHCLVGIRTGIRLLARKEFSIDCKPVLQVINAQRGCLTKTNRA